MNILSIPILLFIPFIISILLMSPMFTSNEVVVRRFTKSVCVFHFVYTLLMLFFFNPENPYFTEIHFFGMDWVQTLGIKFILKTDTISMILCTLTSFVFLMASMSSKFNIRKNHKFYYSMLLLLEFATLGIFTSGDMFLFFLFWELEMFPAYFLIGGDWGKCSLSANESFELDNREDAKKSATKFILFTFFGSMFLLLGILLLHYYNFAVNDILSASFSDITDITIPRKIQLLIALCLIIGFGVKLPIIPLHTWLPDAHTNAPTPISMVLAGIMLKTGAYGIYRFNYEMLPQSFRIIAPLLAILALVNIIYTAFVSYAQTDIKRIIAYSSISNMGLILLGLCAINRIGLSASVLHMVSHGLVTCGLFMIAGIIYLRFKDRNINSLQGVASVMPRLFGFAVLIVLASIGVPFFAPFISEILTIIGAMDSEISGIIKFTALFSLPLLILSSCYMLKFLHKGFFGEVKEEFLKINDITVHEFIILASVLGGLIIFGLFPDAILGFIGK